MSKANVFSKTVFSMVIPDEIDLPESSQSSLVHGDLSANLASYASSIDDSSGDFNFVNILSFGEVHSYTIPSFKVVTFQLRHVGVATADESKFDAFMKEDSDLSKRVVVPSSLKIINACKVEVC